jgi:hypothetical protein
MEDNGCMWARILLAFCAGSVFFAVVPIYAPPVVLQWEGIPPFLLGLGAVMVAGALLILAAGFERGIPLVLASALVGAVLYEVLHALPTYGSEGHWLIARLLVLFTFSYVGLPAAVGAALVGSVHDTVARLRRTRGTP